MTAIQQMVRDMVYAQENSAELNSVLEANYLEWQKFYTWDALVGQRYGQSFCNQFGITDNRLYYERDWIRCDTIIRSEWLARP
jgi:hypothetical protein